MTSSGTTDTFGKRTRPAAALSLVLAASSCGDLLGLDGPVTEPGVDAGNPTPAGGSAGTGGEGGTLGGEGGTLGGGEGGTVDSGNESGSGGVIDPDGSVDQASAGSGGSGDTDAADASDESDAVLADTNDAGRITCQDDGEGPLHCPAPLACSKLNCGAVHWVNGRIPYEFDVGRFAESLRTDFALATAAWSASSSAIRFERCANDACAAAGETKWLRVLVGNEPLLSPVTASGRQDLWLNVGISPHRLAHELGHVLGLPDLWQRPDRDRHVKLSSSFFCSSEHQNEGRKCRVWPGQDPLHPPRATGQFGSFDTRSKMNLYPEQICEGDGQEPAWTSFDPTPLDGSAITELYRTLDGWAPFAPLSHPPTVEQVADGISIAGSPSVSSYGYPDLAATVLGRDGHLYVRWNFIDYGELTGFLAWEDRGCCFDSEPAVIAWPPEQPIQESAFARRTDGHIHWQHQSNAGVTPWSSLGAPAGGAASAPAVAFTGPNRLSLFVRGEDNRLYEKTYDSSWAATWTKLSDFEFRGRPAATGRAPGKIAVAVAGLDNAVWLLEYDSGWATSFESLGGQIHPGSSPAIAALGDRLEVFIRHAGDSRLYRHSRQGASGSWSELGGILAGDPGALAMNNPPRIDIIAPIEDGGKVGLRWKFTPYERPCAGEPDCDACSGAQSETTGTGPCDLTKPFAPPIRLPINDGFLHTGAARLTADQLSLVFGNRDDIYLATRARIGDDFLSSTRLDSVNSNGWEVGPSVTGDGLSIFLESSRDTPTVGRIVMASRPNLGSGFSTPALVASIATSDPNASDIQPYITPDGKVLYFVSTRTGGYDMFRAIRKPDSTEFESPQPLTSLNTAGIDEHPTVSADELTIFWGSNATYPGTRAGLGFDIYMATRPDKNSEFGNIVNVTELNSGNDEFPNWISPDGCTIYLHRWRPDNDMWVARRPR